VEKKQDHLSKLRNAEGSLVRELVGLAALAEQNLGNVLFARAKSDFNRVSSICPALSLALTLAMPTLR